MRGDAADLGSADSVPFVFEYVRKIGPLDLRNWGYCISRHWIVVRES